MGIDTATYRASIGLFFPRLQRLRPRPSDSEHETQGNFDLYVDTTVAFLFSVFLIRGNVSDVQRVWESRSGRARLSRPETRACTLVFTLYVSLLVCCTFKPGLAPTTTQDFSQRLLRSGDVSENPGPDSDSETQGRASASVHDDGNSDMMNRMERMFSEILAMKEGMHKQMNEMTNMISDQYDSLRNEQIHTKNTLQWLCNQQEYLKLCLEENERNSSASYQQLKEWNHFIQAEQNDIKDKLDHVTNNFQDSLIEAERHSEYLELEAKKNNIRLFGVQERERESYWDCLHAVLGLLRESVPDVDWQERDVVSVQRLGPHKNQHGQPRTILVSFTTWSSKLTLLQRGREALRSNGVKVAGEPTKRQARELQDLRRQGRIGYFRNNKLYYRDDDAPKVKLRYAQQGGNRGTPIHNTAENGRAMGKNDRPRPGGSGALTNLPWKPRDRNVGKRRKAEERNLITLSNVESGQSRKTSAENNHPRYEPRSDTADGKGPQDKQPQVVVDVRDSVDLTSADPGDLSADEDDAVLPTIKTRDRNQPARNKSGQVTEAIANEDTGDVSTSGPPLNSDPRAARPERAEFTQRSLLDWVVKDSQCKSAAHRIEQTEKDDPEGEDNEDAFADARTDVDRDTSSNVGPRHAIAGAQGQENVWQSRLRHSKRADSVSPAPAQN